MLNAVHKQLVAARLAELLASSPLVLIYQAIGNVQSAQVSALHALAATMEPYGRH
jgi:hypothetical protein